MAVRVVDLFSGCGGMSVGFEEAVRREGCSLEIPLAVDVDKDALEVYETNLPASTAESVDIATLFDGLVGEKLTKVEKRLKERIGLVDVLIGGPPCQGHSDLNNHTRRADPKNDLYLLMARAAEVFAPKVVVIENVAQVTLDEAGVVEKTEVALLFAGYDVDGRVVDLRRVGVPQRRRRYLLLASKLVELDPASTLERIAKGMPEHPDRSVRWAIEDLVDTKSSDPRDVASRTSEDNAKRIDYLFEQKLFDLPNEERPECHRDREHTYVSMYGRLKWDEPAQTITTGFGSMGQGRYVHPSRRRTITPHEAARLQTFPDWFDFGDQPARGLLAKMIGNAVPPLLMATLGIEIVRALRKETATRKSA